VLKVGPTAISSIYVEADDPSRIQAVSEAIEQRLRGVDARSMDEFAVNFTQLLGQLDKFLLLIVSLALLVGVVGIINTMLMSTTERFSEFGVLRTNGWSQGDVLRLVTLESAFLGLLAGLLGCLLAVAGAILVNVFLKSSGLQLAVTPGLIALGLGLSVVMGTLGGLYPAWRAARLVPMEAIRLGAH
jgi:putative ABC transport system permease protein